MVAQESDDMAVEDMDDSAALPPTPPTFDGDGAILPPNVSEYEKHWDPDQESWYFISTSTGESYWALDGEGDDVLWMEVFDEATNYKYYLHSITGETQWAEEEQSLGLTVWEEMKDPITMENYYYSNANNTAQWSPPEWIDYVDTETNTIYYFHTESGATSWERPPEFVEEAVDDTASYDFSEHGVDETGYAAPEASSIAANDTTQEEAANASFGLMPPPPPGPSSSSTPLAPDMTKSPINEGPTSPCLPSPPPVPRKEPTIHHVSRFTPVPPLPAAVANEGEVGNIAEKRSMDRYEEVPVQLSMSKRPRGPLPHAPPSSISPVLPTCAVTSLSQAATPTVTMVPPDPMFTPPEFHQESTSINFGHQKTAEDTPHMLSEFKQDDTEEAEFMDAEYSN